MYYGLKMAKRRKFSHLIVEVDSSLCWSVFFMVLLALIILLMVFVSQCRNHFKGNWNIMLQHIRRGCSYAAYGLAKLGLTSDMDFQELAEPLLI